MGFINQGLYDPSVFTNGSVDMMGNYIFNTPSFNAPQVPITNPLQERQANLPAPFTLNDYFTAMQQNNPIQPLPPLAPPPPNPVSSNQPEGVRSQVPTSPRPVQSDQNTPQNNSSFGSNPFFSGIQNAMNTLNQMQSSYTPPAPQPTPQQGNTPTSQNQYTPQQQAWFAANPGWQTNVMNAMLGGQQFGFDPMNIQWQNFNNGQTENITRALGVINNPQDLAKLLGGEVVTSPFATFGTTQRDQYIRMPNGQMIDASAIGSLLNNAAASQNPFNALSDVINLMGVWNQQHTNDPNINTDAINLVEQGVISPQAPPGWDPSKFAGGNPTYTPSGPVPGNPSNPGMGTSFPIQFQDGQMQYTIGQNGFPVFNFATNNQFQTPQLPAPGVNTPPVNNPPTNTNQNSNTNQTQPPVGANLNSQYYLPMGKNGLYAQTGTGVNKMNSAGGGGGRFGGGLYSMALNNNTNNQNPFGTPKPSANAQIAGNLPNGTSIIGK